MIEEDLDADERYEAWLEDDPPPHIRGCKCRRCANDRDWNDEDAPGDYCD